MEARPGLCRMVGFGGGGTYGKEVVSAMHQSSGPYGGGYGGIGGGRGMGYNGRRGRMGGGGYAVGGNRWYDSGSMSRGMNSGHGSTWSGVQYVGVLVFRSYSVHCYNL